MAKKHTYWVYLAVGRDASRPANVLVPVWRDGSPMVVSTGQSTSASLFKLLLDACKNEGRVFESEVLGGYIEEVGGAQSGNGFVLCTKGQFQAGLFRAVAGKTPEQCAVLDAPQWSYQESQSAI